MKKIAKWLMPIMVLALFSGCSLFKGEKSVESAVSDTRAEEELEELKEKVKALEDTSEVKVDGVKVDTAKTEDKVKTETATDDSKDKKIAELEKKVTELEKTATDKTKTSTTTTTEKTYTGANYITINKPENEGTFHEEPVVFSGVVSPNTKKITVTAKIGDPNCVPPYDGICVQYHEDVYTLKDFKLGEDSFIYRAKIDWNNLQYGTNEYVFKATFDDSSVKTATRKIYFTSGGAEMGKPVIYLYPEETQEVYVNVKPTNGISISEPEIRDGWNVVATPDSRIYNYADGKVYPYLFWEGFATSFRTPKEGFVIASNDVSKFFDRKLAILGLNEKEIADFKEFWVPRLSEKSYYFITFIPQSDFDSYAPLTVEPKPDSTIRVFFDYKGLDRKISVREQKLSTPERKGFTLVEWGGRLY